MGVAVITSTCGEAPLSISRLRCNTPKRCCSSTMTSPRREKLHGVFDQRVRANHQLRFATLDALEGTVFFRAGAAADDQLDVDSRRARRSRRAER